MPENIRALIYVLVVALPVFSLASKLLQPIMERREFVNWRNAWFATTLAVFLLKDFLLFAVFIGLLSIYLRRQRIDRAYLYLVLLFTAPAVSVDFGLSGLINKIVDLNPARVFALAFLLPRAILLFRQGPGRFDAVDKLVIIFILLLVALSIRLGNLNHVGRVVVMLTLDIALPYFVFSRAFRTTDRIRKATAALVVGALPFAATGMVEIARGWRLYNAVVDQWGIHLAVPYLLRDGLLRAAVTSIEAIAFGTGCMVALGCLLTLRGLKRFNFWWTAALCIIVGGLLASISRGPWIGALVSAFVFTVTARRGLLNLLRTSTVFALILSPLLVSSLGDQLFRLLPFVGTVEKSSEEYRQRLLEISLTVIERYPFFGSPFFLSEPEMQQLIQGQGIIDVVNAYLGIALEYGLVGLFFFVLVAVAVGFQLYKTLVLVQSSDVAVLVRGMMATLAALLFTFGTVSNVSVIPYLYWSIAGLSLGLCRAIATPVEVDVERRNAIPELKIIGGWR